MIRCPVCGGSLRNERHLHAEDPHTVYGREVNPDFYEWDENTVEIREKNVYDYREGTVHGRTDEGRVDVPGPVDGTGGGEHDVEDGASGGD